MFPILGFCDSEDRSIEVLGKGEAIPLQAWTGP